jgi:hypothetical protein
MSPNAKTLIVMFGGMAVSVVTTVCGAAAGFSKYFDSGGEPGQYGLNWLMSAVYGVGIGGAIGATVGMLLWGLLVYMVLRVKKPPKLPPGPPSS